MSAHKLADDLAYPPRAMRAERAAAYLDMSPASFDLLMKRFYPVVTPSKGW